MFEVDWVPLYEKIKAKICENYIDAIKNSLKMQTDLSTLVITILKVR